MRPKCDPESHQEKAKMQRGEKRKEITAGKKWNNGKIL